MDVTISREMTINTGNYENVKPSISITFSDISEDRLDEKFPIMSEIVENLLSIEVVKALQMGSELKTTTDFVNNVLESDIEKDIKILVEDLKS